MTTFAYCRVSSTEQNTKVQSQAVLKAYPDAIARHEKMSGTITKGREVLTLLLVMIGSGDKLVVWTLDRLTCNMGNLMSIVGIL